VATSTPPATQLPATELAPAPPAASDTRHGKSSRKRSHHDRKRDAARTSPSATSGGFSPDDVPGD